MEHIPTLLNLLYSNYFSCILWLLEYTLKRKLLSWLLHNEERPTKINSNFNLERNFADTLTKCSSLLQGKVKLV